MNEGLPGRDISLWIDTTPKTDYPELESDPGFFDVVVVGGGITGVVAAYRLGRTGRKVALVERGRILEWTTGGTTAKLSAQHYLIYDHLTRRHGAQVARAFAEANSTGIDEIEQLAGELSVDCEFSRRPSYVFSGDPGKRAEFEAEVEAAGRLGLPAHLDDAIELPFDSEVAVRFDDQAQFHPRKFLLRLAEDFVSEGGKIFEGTTATAISPGEPNRVVTDRGELVADVVIQASGEPFWRKEILDGRMWTKMSYALAVELEDPTGYPEGMYITTDRPLRSIRSATYFDRPVLIFGGESHEYAADQDEDRHYRNLEKDVRSRFRVRTIICRWLAGDFMPYDRIPFIGPDPEYPSIYVATGYRAWGLAWAMSAVKGIVGQIDGRPPHWVGHFGLERLKTPLRSEDREHGI